VSATQTQSNGHDQRRADLIREIGAALKGSDFGKAHGKLTTLLALGGLI
jgi:hypothetical protein